MSPTVVDMSSLIMDMLSSVVDMFSIAVDIFFPIRETTQSRKYISRIWVSFDLGPAFVREKETENISGAVWAPFPPER